MAIYEHDSDMMQWGLRLLDGDPPFYPGYYSNMVQNEDSYGGQYVRDNYDLSYCTHVESDEIIAQTLQEDFLQLAVAEDSEYSANREENFQISCNEANDYDRHYTPVEKYNSEHEDSHEDSDDTCSIPANVEEYSDSPEYADEEEMDGEVGKRLNQMTPMPHVPRINGEMPSMDEATSDHERLINRLQLYSFVEVKVQGDGNCQFRALSDQLYSTPDRHKLVRKHIVNQLKSHPDVYEGYVPMEYGDYLKKMSKSGEWGDHVTLQAAADAYGVKILVMTSFKDTYYMEILPINQKTKGGDTFSFRFNFLELLGRGTLQLNLFSRRYKFSRVSEEEKMVELWKQALDLAYKCLVIYHIL